MLPMTATYSTVTGPHWQESRNLSKALTHLNFVIEKSFLEDCQSIMGTVIVQVQWIQNTPKIEGKNSRKKD